jgi:hypothetical protein
MVNYIGTKLAGNYIRTYKNRFDYSETILGPFKFKKLTFFGPWARPASWGGEERVWVILTCFVYGYIYTIASI